VRRRPPAAVAACGGLWRPFAAAWGGRLQTPAAAACDGGLRRRPAATACERFLCLATVLLSRARLRRRSSTTRTLPLPRLGVLLLRAPSAPLITHHARFLCLASVFFSCARLRRHSSRMLPLPRLGVLLLRAPSAPLIIHATPGSPVLLLRASCAPPAPLIAHASSARHNFFSAHSRFKLL